ADDPDALSDQIVRKLRELGRIGGVDLTADTLQLGDARPLVFDPRFTALIGGKNLVPLSLPDAVSQAPHQRFGALLERGDSQTHAQSDLGVVLKQRVVPRRAASVAIGAVRSRR